MIGYQYVTLRLVPRVEREEFINVAVVLYAQDTDFLDLAWELDPARARALCPTLDLEAVVGTLTQLQALCHGDTTRSGGQLATMPRLGQRFGWVIAPRSTIVQPGPVHAGLCDDPAAELERLVSRLVRAATPT